MRQDKLPYYNSTRDQEIHVKHIRKLLEIVVLPSCTEYTRARDLSKMTAMCGLTGFDLPLDLGYNSFLDLDDIGERE